VNIRWWIRILERLPVDDLTKRALVETVADGYYARAGFVASLARVIARLFVSFSGALHPFRHLRQDVRAAIRRLRTAPLYASFAVGTLALAIGSSTAVYAIVDAIVVQRQPIRDFARVVNIYHADPRKASPRDELSVPDFVDLRRDARSYTTIAAWHRFSHVIVTENGSSPMMGESVTGNYFDMFGVTPLLGRTLMPADDQPGAPPVIVLAESTWRRLLAGRASAIGDTVRFGGLMFEVVGVMPESFRGSDMPVLSPTPFWIPMSAEARIAPVSGYRQLDGTDRDARILWVKGRLRDDVSLASAQAELSAIAARLDRTVPIGASLVGRDRTPERTMRRWTVVPMQDIYLHESMHRLVVPMLSLVLSLVVLVLLVACSNLANLTLARTARRSQELAIRLALGASRGRLIREQLVEGAVLTAAGWSLGIVIAMGLIPLLGSSTQLSGSMTITIQLHPQLNTPVLIASFVAALLALSVSSLGPALKHSRGQVRQGLSSDHSATAAPRWRTRGSLIAGQVFVSTVLLAIAAVCVNELQRSQRIDSGIDLERLAITNYNFGFNRTEPARIRQELGAVLETARAIPGVDRVAVATGLPFGLSNPRADVFSLDQPYARDRSNGHNSALLISTSSVFETLGVQIVAGRAFDDTASGGPLTAVISELLADQIFGSTERAVGHQIQYKHQQWAGDPEHPVMTLTVVGVAADTDAGIAGSRQYGTLYLPINQHDETKWSVIARVSGDPAVVVPRLQEVMRNIDRDVPLVSAGTGPALAGPTVLVYQVVSLVAGLLGFFALLLASTGLYGVIADLVSRRTREIGIRIALGAERRGVERMVFLEGMRPVMIGLVLGLALSVSVRMALKPLLRQLIPPSAVATILFGMLPLIAAAILACYIPARRAARVDPNVALRDL
jgi:predicted permease